MQTDARDKSLPRWDTLAFHFRFFQLVRSSFWARAGGVVQQVAEGGPARSVEVLQDTLQAEEPLYLVTATEIIALFHSYIKDAYLPQVMAPT